MSLETAILDAQGPDGVWRLAGEPDWVPTLRHATLLRELGADPYAPRVADAMARLALGFRWDAELGAKPFFVGEVEPCINGQTLAVGGWCGRGDDALAARLRSEQLADGGWNCEARPHASFHTTICVLEGLLAYQRTGGIVDVRAARARGEAYLLERGLMRRRSTGQVVKPEFLAFAFPASWHYDVLRALAYLVDAGVRDERMREALQLVADKRQPDGTWRLEASYTEGLAVDLGETIGAASRWITARASRVLGTNP